LLRLYNDDDDADDDDDDLQYLFFQNSTPTLTMIHDLNNECKTSHLYSHVHPVKHNVILPYIIAMYNLFIYNTLTNGI